VLQQTVQNELTLFFIKDMNQSKTNLHSINQKPMHTASTQKILHSINPLTMHTASDFL